MSEQRRIDGNMAEPEDYDEWLRREIEVGLREANAPGAVRYTPEEVCERIRRMSSQTERSALGKSTCYEEWLEHELAIGLKEADDPTAESFSVEEVDGYMQQQKAAYLRQTLEKAS